jgi:ABC-type sugar transport system ATPase subunit
MVFQNPALYPHLNVEANLSFGLMTRRIGSEVGNVLVQQVADQLQLASVLKRFPAQLSGGQKARVALGRALASVRPVLLLDEPFSGLDAPLRVALRETLVEIQASQGFTLLFITHDIDDAAVIGERVAIFDKGTLVESGSINDLYETARSLKTFGLLARSRLNRFDGKLFATEKETRLLRDRRILLHGPPNPRLARSCQLGQSVVAVVPPEAFRLATEREGLLSTSGTVQRFEGVGSERRAVLHTPEGTMRISLDRVEIGAEIRVEADPDRIHWFDRETGARLGTP